jgi:hypothetical protein
MSLIAKSFSCLESLESRTLFSASFLSQLSPIAPVMGNTVPGNGDVNPYGVAFVPADAAGGKLYAGDVLVSNFNNYKNTQGTATTIVEINPKNGDQTLFFQGKGTLGLTTALGLLPGGFVLVGNVPANPDGTADGPGSLLIINKYGDVVKTLVDSKLLDGPWDLTVVNNGLLQTVFVSNVLNGTVTRLDLLINPFGNSSGNGILVLDKTQIASGYEFRTDPNAFLVGPTGLAFNACTDTLYVASTDDNAIYAISDAQFLGRHNGTGKLIFSNYHLRGPLALAFAPNGDLLTANGDAVNTSISGLENSEIVEFTPSGKYVTEFQIDPTIGGAFGLAVETQGNHVVFAAVDDVTNELDVWSLLV